MKTTLCDVCFRPITTDAGAAFEVNGNRYEDVCKRCEHNLHTVVAGVVKAARADLPAHLEALAQGEARPPVLPEAWAPSGR